MIGRQTIGFVLVVTIFLAAPTAIAARFVDRLPGRSGPPIEGFSYANVMTRLSQLPLHHIEGIWQFTDTDVEIAIVRHTLYSHNATPTSDGGHYLMIVLSAPNRTIRPGTVMGHISRGGETGVYNARIYTSSVGRYLTMPKTFTIDLDSDDNSFSLRMHNSPLQIFLWRFAPYLWRYPITPEYQNINRRGCVRTYPTPLPPLEPIYL